MFSVVSDGKVLDFNYKKHGKDAYRFYIGDIFVGLIFHMLRGNWVAVYTGDRKPKGLTKVAGFKNRYYASEYLLLVGGYWNND